MAKIYLSPALHAHDNPTKCPQSCGENVHCNQYMDIVERRLRELGFAVKRGDKALTGTPAMKARTREANKWGADLYYVAHTNAGGGRYAVTYCWPDTESKQKAAVLGKYRKAVEAHNGYKWRCKTTKELYEINQTAMVTLYDELFFHDNAEDCRWFHDGGMALIAEETVQAMCELCDVPYKPVAAPAPAQPVKPAEKPADVPVVAPVAPVVPVTPAAPAAPKVPQPGDKVTLTKGKLYVASTGKLAVTRTGTFYVYDGKKINGRYRVTNRTDRVLKKPLLGNVSGWVEL